MGEWLPRWLTFQVQLNPTTMVRYEVALRRQILPRWELVPLSRITHSDVSSWVHGLTDEGLAPATVRYATASCLWPSQRPSGMDGSSGTSPRAYPSPAFVATPQALPHS